MRISRNLWLRLGYVAFGGVALLLSFYATFPAQAVGQRLAHEVQVRSRGVVSVTFGDASLYRFSGVSLSNVKMTVLRDGREPLMLDFDEAAARLKILPLVLFRPALSARLTLGKGTVIADVTKKGNAWDVALDIDDLDFTSPPMLPKLAGIPLNGKLDALGSVLYADPPTASNGSLTIDLKGSSVGAGVLFGFAIPQVGLGDVKLQLDIKDGRAKVTSFENSGGNLAFTLGGEIQLKPVFSGSTLDGCVTFKAVDAAWLEKNEKIKAAMTLAE
ncbi:MAG: type II secretion system protein GspN, partial [Clostridia bacterium]|nr:type II secretion system protein GspN [Deltaproteobacteria bacterium]